MRKIILCADDYGQSAPISAGIAQLVERGRLSAVSCMTEGEFWSSAANTLPTHRQRIDIGLHFNLTQPVPDQSMAPSPLRATLLRALLGNIDGDAVDRTLRAQLDRFEAVLGQPPDFVDGHQHVHVFPHIRTRVLALLAARYPRRKPYLRALTPRLRGGDGMFKRLLLKGLGSGFAECARRRDFALSGGFAGIYSLSPQADYARLMRGWLRAAHSGDLIMCHPGLAANDPADPIAATRPRELEYLSGDVFAALLAREHIELVRFRDL